MALQRPLWRLNQLFARHMLAPCIKAGLALQGFAVGDPFHPQAPQAEAQEDVRRTLASLGLSLAWRFLGRESALFNPTSGP